MVSLCNKQHYIIYILHSVAYYIVIPPDKLLCFWLHVMCEYTHNYIHCIIDLTQRGWHTLRCSIPYWNRDILGHCIPMIHSLLMYYHPLNHHSVSCTNLRQAHLFNACTEAVTCSSVFHQQRYTQDNQSHFIKLTSYFVYVFTSHLLPGFSSSHHVIRTFQHTKIYQLCNRVLQDVREGISAANASI